MRHCWVGIVVGLVLLGCGTDSSSASQSVLIRDVPHVRQKPDFCGEACVASWLRKIGCPADQDAVFDLSGLDPSLGRGCYTKELATAIRQLGFEPGAIWNRLRAPNQANGVEQNWIQLLADLHKGVPSIICMRTKEGAGSTEHFRLVLGYDERKDEVIYHEPAADNGAYHRMARQKFMSLWPLKYDPNEWTLIRFALATNQVPTARAATSATDADYAQHIMQLKAKLPHDGFTIVLQKPFVVIGDEPAEMVRRRSDGTVDWAVKRLKARYFAKDPKHILNIWLFKDAASYESNAIRLFGSKPSTPYGYYSPSNRALVMNISTGGGTLVHEIVHPFIESNFEDCPSWFNEGLGSLYEQSGTSDGRIIGLTNWRLAGLQRAITKDSVPSFATLCGTTRTQFYNEDPGTNYAQARYLCYYLQERGLLQKYYHSFVANHKQDPTGYKTLQKILATEDMEKFKSSWQDYVMKLKFP